MSELQIQNSANGQNNTLVFASENNNKKIINQEQIISTRKTKKIFISKNVNSQNSPQRLINSNKIYNRRKVSPKSNKIIQKSPNSLYHLYQAEEIKEENENINNNNTCININTKSNDYIYKQEDFNNNFYINELNNIQIKNKNFENNYKNQYSYEYIKNKKLSKINYNYISPKNNSKVLLKTVICNPISVRLTEIQNAELNMNKIYKEKIEEIEETEISIKNKIMTIWDNTNKVINENNLSIINEEDLERKNIIESYKKEIEEYKEIITKLKREIEENTKNEYSDNLIQSFNPEQNKARQKSKNNSLVIKKIGEIFIPRKPKFKNIKQKINYFCINKISKPINIIQSTGKIIIESIDNPKYDYEIIKYNEIFIQGKKVKFTSDKIYGQELSIIAKKKKRIFQIEQIEPIIIFKNEKSPLEINSDEGLCLSGDDNYFLNRFNENNNIEEINNIYIPGLIKPENIIEKGENIIIDDSFNKPDYIIEQLEPLYIEPLPKISELYKENIDIIFLEEKLRMNLEMENLDEILIKGKEKALYNIEQIEEIILISENKKKLFSENKIEKVDNISLYTNIEYYNNKLDIEIKDDIFYDEIPRPENEIEELEGINYLKEKKLANFLIEKKESLMIERSDSYEEEENQIEYTKKYKQIKNNLDDIIEYIIEDTANFQIISMSIRELYQQKLQGFSIIKREKELNEIEQDQYFSINNENCNEYINKSATNINKYYNKTYDINKKRNIDINKDNYREYNFNTRTINTIISKNYKSFNALPKGNIEYIDPKEIFDENKNNELYLSGDESSKRKKIYNNVYQRNINTSEINNDINKRYNSKILLSKNNYYNNNQIYDLNNKPKEKEYSFNQTEKKYYKSTPTKINDNQTKSEYTTFSVNRIHKRKIYRFEEGNKMKVIKDKK